MFDRAVYKSINNIKSRIEKLIESGHLDEAKEMLIKLESKLNYDQDIYSMQAVVHFAEGNLEAAEDTIIKGLKRDSVHFDLLFNLAYLYEYKGSHQKAADLYCLALTAAKDAKQRKSVYDSICRMKLCNSSIDRVNKTKIVFFLKDATVDLEEDLIKGLSDTYWVRKIVDGDPAKIEEGMEWADVCWLSMCDDLMAYCSRRELASRKIVICRARSAESIIKYRKNIWWDNIDKLVFANELSRNTILEYLPELNIEKTSIIPDCIDVYKYNFKNRRPGLNIALGGDINNSSSMILLLHAFKAICDCDNRYKLYLADELSNSWNNQYFYQMVKNFGIEENVIFYEQQKNMDSWLENKDYFLCTSIFDCQYTRVMQAMVKGIKPVIHNFVGAEGIFPAKYIWSTINEAVEMVTSDCYQSEEYHNYVKEYCHTDIIAMRVKDLLTELSDNRPTEPCSIAPSLAINRKPLISLVYRNYCGSNSVSLHKTIPRELLDSYRIELVRQDNSEKYFNSLNDSKMIITTHGCVKIRSDQLNLDLWHGFPLKAMGDMIAGISKDDPNIREKVWSLADAVISYSQLYSSLFNACVGVGGEKFVITGAPRNDFLLKSDGRSILSNILDKDLQDKKVIFFLPTFRNTLSGRNDGNKSRDNIFGMEEFDNIRFDDFLKENDIILFAKLHPHEESIFIKVMEDMKTENIRILSNTLIERNSIELYEILNSADLLITDYSSVYFDFLLLDKPIIFTPVDINSYSELRGFLLEPFDYWTPGPKSIDQTSLENEIISCLSNNSYYSNERQMIKKLVHHYQDGESCRRTWDVVKSMLGE